MTLPPVFILSYAVDYTEFSAVSGEAVEVVLEFHDVLIGAVYDKFGEEVKMVRTGEHTITCAVRVQISPPFWGWLFQFSDAMTIKSPDSLIEEYRRKANGI